MVACAASLPLPSQTGWIDENDHGAPENVWMLHGDRPVAVLAAGCAREDAGDSANVSPPAAQSQPADTATSTIPPGGLELPPGGVPARDATPADVGKRSDQTAGGIEMPSGAVPAVNDSSQRGGRIEYAEWEQVQRLATTSGKVTVVDLWSLVCAPCIKEFPGLVALDRAHGDAVQCVAVDLDYDGRKSKPPETYEAEVTAFLQSVGADFTNFISKTPNDEVFAAAGIVSIPAVLIYDADGMLVKTFGTATNGFTYESDIIPFVRQLADK